MTVRVVEARMKGFISLDAHPSGCARNVESLVAELSPRPSAGDGRPDPTERPIVVIGASGGYGLPAIVAALFRVGAPVVAVALERPADARRTASAGWYNLASLRRLSAEAGHKLVSINGDCFSDQVKEAVASELERLGPPSHLIYSVAAPARTDPRTGVTHRSVLKPIGSPFATKTVRIDTGQVEEVSLEPADEDEIADTVKVMGGEDWAAWIEALSAVGFASDLRTVAFSYVGPAQTHPIYRSGTIGRAKADLEATAERLRTKLGASGGAWVSVNSAAVTQSSAAIPAVPLYLSLLLAVAARNEAWQGPGEQIRRLFDDHLFASEGGLLDEQSRIRLDDWELDDGIQAEVARRWQSVTTESLETLGDFAGFQRAFRNLFGFDVEGIDYADPVETQVEW